MSVQLARLDMSKPCESHAIVMRKSNDETPLPERTWRAPARKRKARASAVLPDAGDVLRQRDEVKAMRASGTIARTSLL